MFYNSFGQYEPKFGMNKKKVHSPEEKNRAAVNVINFRSVVIVAIFQRCGGEKNGTATPASFRAKK